MRTTDAARVIELGIGEGQRAAELYPPAPTAPNCGAQAERRRGRGITATYICTREPHTDGPHVAHAPGGAVATWETR